MNNKRIIAAAGLLVFLWLTLPLDAQRDPIMPEHRICLRDTDCTVLTMGCGYCMGGDSSLRIDAINLQFVRNYAALNQCSSMQLRRGMTNHCLFASGLPGALCDRGICKVQLPRGRVF